MDNKIERITKNAFSSGSLRDASAFLTLCVKNAFPDFNFRGVEVIRLSTGDKVLEGKSWNHVFLIRRSERNGKYFWDVTCHRISHGDTEDKHVFLSYDTLTLTEV